MIWCAETTCLLLLLPQGRESAQRKLMRLGFVLCSFTVTDSGMSYSSFGSYLPSISGYRSNLKTRRSTKYQFISAQIITCSKALTSFPESNSYYFSKVKEISKSSVRYLPIILMIYYGTGTYLTT
jgi:hypothetical protein